MPLGGFYSRNWRGPRCTTCPSTNHPLYLCPCCPKRHNHLGPDHVLCSPSHMLAPGQDTRASRKRSPAWHSQPCTCSHPSPHMCKSYSNEETRNFCNGRPSHCL